MKIMQRQTIAVMAGTPTDTAFGVKLAESAAENVLALPVSASPEEQTVFQTMDPESRFRRIRSILESHREISALLVYCNSLSGTVDFDRMARLCGIDIVTPLQFYRDIAGQYRSFGVISANAQGGAGIEREIVSVSPEAKIHSVSSLAWVNAVEAEVPPEEIFSRLGMREILQFFDQMETDCILFGCTHFPYFMEEVQKKTDIPCLSPDGYMAEKIRSCLSCKSGKEK